MHSIRLSGLLVVCVSILLSGCGDTRPFQATIVHGSVSFQGTPIQNGEIRFYPKDGTKGPVSGGPIKDGRFEVKTKGGVPVGNHSVKIQAFQTTTAKQNEDLPPEVAADFSGDLQQFLPQKFNTNTELTAEVFSSEKRQQLDFDLQD
ncbi:MAG: hypothetical protein P8J27_08490 [Mariniblastus sp.]|nr:hypothetical protein [Mariniblastus sp.]